VGVAHPPTILLIPMDSIFLPGSVNTWEVKHPYLRPWISTWDLVCDAACGPVRGIREILRFLGAEALTQMPTVLGTVCKQSRRL
jgi:hypothetical protein